MIEINNLCNTYGCVVVREHEGKYQCAVLDCFEPTDDDWEDISETLYIELLKFKRESES